MTGSGRILVCCDGAPPPSVGGPWDRAIDLTTKGPTPSVDLKIDGLKHKVFGEFNPRAEDLIRIAAFAYAADMQVSRGGAADVHLERWQRTFTLAIPVCDPVFWQRDEIRTALQDALGFATEDRWSFVFTREPPGQLTLNLDPRLPLAFPDSVVLLSGGTDSLCAAVAAVREQGRRPLLVSHRSAPHLDHRQRDVANALDAQIDEWGFPHISFWVQRRGGRMVEETQRTRAFLYAALGAAVAVQAKVRDVLLADNGYVSLNPPISGQLVLARASRGTHPTLLRLTNTLLAQVFPDPVAVTNPLWDQTRAEALAVLRRQGLASLLALTQSCGKSLRVSGHSQCGTCSQCIDRRFAVEYVGLATADHVAGYITDCFADPLPEGEARTVVRSFVEFALESEGLGPDALFLKYPTLADALDASQPDVTTVAESLAHVLTRHAREVLTVLEHQLTRHRAAIVRGQVPPESLLGSLPRLSTAEPSVAEAPQEDDLEQFALDRPVACSRDGDEEDSEPPIEPATTTVDPACRLTRVGKTWVIHFHGEEGTIDETVGWTRLMRLLRQPGVEFTALDLVSGSNPEPVHRPVRLPEHLKRTLEDAATQAGFTVRVDDVLDPKAMKALRDGRNAAARAKREANKRGDQEAYAVAHNEWKLYDDVLRQSVGLGGETRSFTAKNEQARTTVAKTIGLCYDKLLSMPTLHAHLTRFVHLGYTCSYDPHPPEHWDITS